MLVDHYNLGIVNMDEVKILDKNGQPIQHKKSMLAGGGSSPYDAADIHGEHMSEWNPILWSPDAELNPYRDRIVSRVRDLVRNDGGHPVVLPEY